MIATMVLTSHTDMLAVQVRPIVTEISSKLQFVHNNGDRIEAAKIIKKVILLTVTSFEYQPDAE